MDINASLTVIRAEIARFIANGEKWQDSEDADSLAFAVKDLDEWLSRGGHLPSEWMPEGTSATRKLNP